MTRRPLVEVEREYHCPSCGVTRDLHVDHERGVVVCRRCGTVVHEGAVDVGPEWRKPDSSRAAAGPLGTSMGAIERGNVKLGDKLKALRLMKFSRPPSTTAERLEIDVKEFMESARVKLGIPKAAVEEAAAIYRRLYEAGYRAPRNEGMAAALYFALKRLGMAATSRSFMEKLGLDRGAFTSAYMELVKVAHSLGMRPQRVDPKVYIPRIVNGLRLTDEKSAEVQRIAADLLRYIYASPKLRNGRKPQMLAAVAVYYACYIAGVEVTQKDLARAADSTEGPIRELLRELSRAVRIEITV